AEEAGDAAVVADERLRLAVEVERGDAVAHLGGEVGEAGPEDLPGGAHLVDLLRALEAEGRGHQATSPRAAPFGFTAGPKMVRIDSVTASMGRLPLTYSTR